MDALDAIDAIDAIVGAANSSGAPAGNATCVVVEVHDTLFRVVDSIQGEPTDLVHTLTPYGVLAISLVLCFFGLYAIRLVVGVAAFSAGIIGTVRLLQMAGSNADQHGLAVSCDIATIVVLLSGGVTALVAVLMTRMLSTVLGAAGACLVVGATFAACGPTCDADLWVGAPRFLNLTLVPFWCSILVAAVLGAFVAHKRHNELLATLAAILGGFGVGLAARSLVPPDEQLPNWGFLAIVAASSLVGLTTQYQYRRLRRKRKLRKQQERQYPSTPKDASRA